MYKYSYNLIIVIQYLRYNIELNQFMLDLSKSDGALQTP